MVTVGPQTALLHLSVPAAEAPDPNLIALTWSRVLAAEALGIEIDGIDALADTPVLDIEP